MPLPSQAEREESYQKFLHDFPKKSLYQSLFESHADYQKRMLDFFFERFSSASFLTQKDFFDVLGALFYQKEIRSLREEGGATKYYFADKNLPSGQAKLDEVGLFNIMTDYIFHAQKAGLGSSFLKLLAGFQANIGFDENILKRIAVFICNAPRFLDHEFNWMREFHNANNEIDGEKLIKFIGLSADKFNRLVSASRFKPASLMRNLFVQNYPQLLFEADIGDFVIIARDIADEGRRGEIFKLYLEKNREKLLSGEPENFCQFISFCNQVRVEFVLEYVNRNKEKILRLKKEQLALIIYRADILPQGVNDIVRKYFIANDGFVFEDYFYLLSAMPRNEVRQSLVRYAVEFCAEDFNKISIENLLKILRLTTDTALIARILVDNEALANVDNFCDIVRNLKEEVRAYFIKEYVKSKPALSIADLAKVAQVLEFKQKVELTAVFLAQKPRPNLEQIIELVGVFDGDLKAKLLAYLELQRGAVKPVEALFEVISLVDEIADITDLAKNAKKVNYIAALLNSGVISGVQGAEIMKLLYPNDMVRYGILSRCNIIAAIISSEERKDFIHSLAHEMNDGEALTWFVNFLFDRRLVENEAEKLELIRGFYSRAYQISVGILSQYSLNQEGVLSEEGVRWIREVFGEDFAFGEYNLADLLSYHYYLGSSSQNFARNLTPEFKAQLASQIKLPNSPFVTQLDYLTLQGFVEDFHLPEVALIANYLRGKKNAPRTYDLANYVINFNDVSDPKFDANIGSFSSEIAVQKREFSEEKKREITTQFLHLQTVERPDEESVMAFFANFYYEEDFAEISSENKQKIYTLFIANKQHFLHAFAQGGLLAKFIAESSSVGDGCVKNIATKFATILYQTMMDSESSAAIYNYFIDRILVVLGQMPTSFVGDVNHGGDVSGDPILANQVVNGQYLNLEGFFADLAQYISGMELDLKYEIFQYLITTNPVIDRYVAHLEGEERIEAVNKCFSIALEGDEVYEKYGKKRYDQFALLIVSWVCKELIRCPELDQWPKVQAFVNSDFIPSCVTLRKLLAEELEGVPLEAILPPEIGEEMVEEEGAGEYMEVNEFDDALKQFEAALEELGGASEEVGNGEMDQDAAAKASPNPATEAVGAAGIVENDEDKTVGI